MSGGCWCCEEAGLLKLYREEEGRGDVNLLLLKAARVRAARREVARNFWLTKLDQFSLSGEVMRDRDAALSRIRRAQMVEAFVDSVEYGNRFGP